MNTSMFAPVAFVVGMLMWLVGTLTGLALLLWGSLCIVALGAIVFLIQEAASGIR